MVECRAGWEACAEAASWNCCTAELLHSVALSPPHHPLPPCLPRVQDNLGSCAMLEACKYGQDELVCKLKSVRASFGMGVWCCCVACQQSGQERPAS